MKFFIDTANVEDIRRLHELGLVDGVTTNPSLVAREGRNFREVINEICSFVKGPVSAEAVSLDADGMIGEAKDIATWAENIVVKIPMTAEGLKAVRWCANQNIHTNVTLIFTATQALLAAKAGASYVSPFVGRLDDIVQDGIGVVPEIRQIFDNYCMHTEIIVASVRNPLHVRDAALAGADIATIPPKVVDQMIKHPLTDIGIARFLKDWESAKK
ncbi:MAG: fructose-6-phosphate aldolase [Acidobacteria bacterium CG_4_9_14_3_um_filter_49_7]|nr:MAG: fructose-6-phosphate aldolase [Acidobacteria bacterium CG_4_9_14_3_um_filter_49_7]